MAIVAAAGYGDARFHLVGHDWGSMQLWDAVTTEDTDERLSGRLLSFTSIGGPSLDHMAHVMRRARNERDLNLLVRQGMHSWYVYAFQLPWLPEQLWRRATRQLRRRIARASYTDIGRSDVPASLQEVLAKSMSRAPHERYASARDFGAALQRVQEELRLASTPLEVPAAEWAPAARTVDFADGTLRGPARSRVEREGSRKFRDSSGVRGLARDEDTDISTPTPRVHRSVPWVLGALALVAAGAVVVAALFATGVL